jgi:hypothetical protein
MNPIRFTHPALTTMGTVVALALASQASAQVVLPYTETFSDGTEGQNASPVSGSLDFNNFTYSVDGTGGVALYDLASFLGASYGNISGLGVLGDHQWSGTTTHHVHTFSFASDGGINFNLQAFDFVTSNAGPPHIYTVTGYQGATQVAQITGLDLSLTSTTTYGTGTANQLTTSNIGPGGDIYGQHVAFSGSGWGTVNRIVLSSTGNDILVGLDNIQMGIALVPEPAHYAGFAAFGLVGWALARRIRRN